MEVVASLSQGRTAAAQCGLFTHKSVLVIFEPPCIILRRGGRVRSRDSQCGILPAQCVVGQVFLRAPRLSHVSIISLTRSNNWLIHSFINQRQRFGAEVMRLTHYFQRRD